MNKYNIEILIDCIKNSESFNMIRISNDDARVELAFKNPSCILGHCYLLMAKADPFFDCIPPIIRGIEVRRIFGLSFDQFKNICYPKYEYANYRSQRGRSSYITKDHAIRMLEHFLKTGKVNWKKTRNPKFGIKNWANKCIQSIPYKNRKQKFDMQKWMDQLQSEELNNEL